MMDRGFTIDDILLPGVQLNRPLTLNETGQLKPDEQTNTEELHHYGYVERAN